MSDSFTAAIALAPEQRLVALQAQGLVIRVADERRRWQKAWDHFYARWENRLIERVLLSRIRKAFDHLDNPEALRAILVSLREDYARGNAATLSVTAGSASPLEAAEDVPLPAAWLGKEQRLERVLIYTAGGGFLLPPSQPQIQAAQRLGELCGTDTLINLHALSPEAPFPEPIDDTERLITWACERYGASNVVLAADTAGASISLGALLKMRDAGAELPAAIQLFSPWNDLSLSGWSYITKSATADSPFRMETAAFCARAYLGNVPASNPLASAVFAELHDLPALAIHTSRFDMHFDDALSLIQRISEGDGHGEIRYWDSPRHHLERFDSEAANASLKMASGFLRRHLDVRGVAP
ncbi:alpha/beta hydrolase fold domain-containing protein [Congregibacter litoralis]|uniref:Esterase/lipase n=1 Tax=Congregibacter litoralis KT71 TaxID=314285 RepID=A4ABP3_9GAMM|nr:alpha/beta hydrolase [Congregibacter litoralis]EAQ96556.1 Esterase/lipase [Congregibacter litoralis KT71]